ncbi:hypothetical protein I7I51_00618 [Histoplasma capsulatum]|uniref:Uncharacterized protein n=1 Tax=Ajellomyces capsulatus TaxID=5037 RepID=A0A8A1MEH4_AJECA|nr:hypothetical protein I7I51_00618 [Histoplasma capsulatum]
MLLVVLHLEINEKCPEERKEKESERSYKGVLIEEGLEWKNIRDRALVERGVEERWLRDCGDGTARRTFIGAYGYVTGANSSQWSFFELMRPELNLAAIQEPG